MEPSPTPPLFMNVYSTDLDLCFFRVPYYAKGLLQDSVTRTFNGYHSICKGEILVGCGNLLLARIESVVAMALVVLSAALIGFCSVILTPMFVVPTIILNLVSRLPCVSSYPVVQNFKDESALVLYRVLRAHQIAIPVIFLFLTASAVNAVLPGVLKEENSFFNLIHQWVECLGPLHTINAVVPNKVNIMGTKERASVLETFEEYLRALSCENKFEKEVVDVLTCEYQYGSSQKIIEVYSVNDALF